MSPAGLGTILTVLTRVNSILPNPTNEESVARNSESWESRTWSCVRQGTETGMSVLARASSNLHDRPTDKSQSVRQWNMVVGPAELGIKNECAVEGQQQFTSPIDQTHTWSWKEHSFGHESRRDSKPRINAGEGQQQFTARICYDMQWRDVFTFILPLSGGRTGYFVTDRRSLSSPQSSVSHVCHDFPLSTYSSAIHLWMQRFLQGSLWRQSQVYDSDSLETAVRRVGGWCEMAASLRERESGQRRNIHCWNTFSNSAVKTVSGKTNLCVIVICKLKSRVVQGFSKSDYQSRPRL
jgi:hypothetical protein